MFEITLQYDNPVSCQLVKSTYVLQICLIRFLNFTLVVVFAPFLEAFPKV